MDDREAQARLDAALVERAVRDADARAFEVLMRGTRDWCVPSCDGCLATIR
ncbi:MAG: hypothetical protein LW768_05840 [Rubrivivax sp.]|jgi:hypothetical protein|nr:hypothetical protein [Rubrivivax sp.]